MSPRVSIPHRYGKNDANNVNRFLQFIEFPFLIGTVRTWVERFGTYVDMLFPFLIGTVRTRRFTKVVGGMNLTFPFLIGTVRTKAT